MRTKFEHHLVVEQLQKKNPISGVSFHHSEPFIIASLRCGKIQLWNYHTATLISSYEGHKGRVRGLHFHRSKPLFVSGGDDYDIRIWNYQTQHFDFALRGHTDNIRTVEFHKKRPWIISASDDKRILIWNFNSKSCIYTLTGHEHYVMCASFHPKEDLVVSASLDGTVRVWNLTSLVWSVVSSVDLNGVGVHWASFHPSLPLIVSGADDGLVKLWRMNEGTGVLAEVDTLRGHTGAVTSVLFNAKRDLILSRSEDRSICVWDATKRTLIRTFSREGGRFCTLAVHPEINLLAASHDKGMVVFKCFERKRPAFALGGGGDSLFYAKDGYLYRYEYSTKEDLRLSPISSLNTLHQSPSTLSCSPTSNAVLICSDLNGGSYELYPGSPGMAGAKSGTGGSAVFISNNQFVVLNRDRSTFRVENLMNKVVEESSLPTITDAIFYAGTEILLSGYEHEVAIFDPLEKRVLCQLETSPSFVLRQVVWSTDMSWVALLSKDTIIIANKKLALQETLVEKSRVKSGAWDDNGNFIYTTSNQLKFLLPNGVTGIIRTLEAPTFITKIIDNNIFCLDGVGKISISCIQTSEVKNHRKNVIYWDSENIPLPRGFPGDAFYTILRKRLTEAGYPGGIKVSAVVGYLDDHVPPGLDRNFIDTVRARPWNRPTDSRGDQAADIAIKRSIRSLLAVRPKKKPRNVIFITGDKGYSKHLEKMKSHGHNLMAVLRKIPNQPDSSSQIKEQVSKWWYWNDFLEAPDKETKKRMREKEEKETKKENMDKKRLDDYEKRQRKKKRKAGAKSATTTQD